MAGLVYDVGNHMVEIGAFARHALEIFIVFTVHTHVTFSVFTD